MHRFKKMRTNSIGLIRKKKKKMEGISKGIQEGVH